MKFIFGVALMAAGISAFLLVNRERNQLVLLPAETTMAVGDPDRPKVPVVVELFTSEGCSSCPPADEVLANLVNTQSISGVEVIGLSEHVDYWNQLGWADPFSSAQYSDRQNLYANAFGQNGIYTPQMVVGGTAEFNGSDARRARAAIVKAASEPTATVDLAFSTDSLATRDQPLRISVKISALPKLSTGDTAEVVLVILENGLASSVSRGENRGRELKHTAVVRQMTPLGAIQENKGIFAATPVTTLNPAWKIENRRVVVFVQERNSRKMLGAASLKVNG